MVKLNNINVIEEWCESGLVATVDAEAKAVVLERLEHRRMSLVKAIVGMDELGSNVPLEEASLEPEGFAEWEGPRMVLKSGKSVLVALSVKRPE